MDQFSLVQTAPLIWGEDGTIRVAGSRVTLDSVVHAFQRGATAEDIREQFPSLSLCTIYGTLAYYLEHQTQIEAYLQKQQRADEETQQEVETRSSSASLRAQVKSRRERQATS